MSLLDPPPNEKQIAEDIAAFEANPVMALFRFADYFDDNGIPIKGVPPHIVQFVVGRLKLFTEGRPPHSLQQAFRANKQNRNRASNDRIRADIHYDIMFKRSAGERPNPQSLVEKYGISESLAAKLLASVTRKGRAESIQKGPPLTEKKID